MSCPHLVTHPRHNQVRQPSRQNSNPEQSSSKSFLTAFVCFPYLDVYGSLELGATIKNSNVLSPLSLRWIHLAFTIPCKLISECLSFYRYNLESSTTGTSEFPSNLNTMDLQLGKLFCNTKQGQRDNYCVFVLNSERHVLSGGFQALGVDIQ